MSWHKISLPIPPMKQIDPKVVEIGDLARECWMREKKPAGFGMLHASRGSDPNEHDTRFVYLSPVATELCREALSDSPLKPAMYPRAMNPASFGCSAIR